MVARLTTDALLTVSIRSVCESEPTELACGFFEAVADVSAGDAVFVLVDGAEAPDSGAFELEVFSRPANVCGDDALDPDEPCDDGNTDASDGCDQCVMKLGETEPNDDAPTADDVSVGYAAIDPAGDVDVFTVVVSAPGSALSVGTTSFGGWTCTEGLLDSHLEVLGTDGTTILGEDDDSGLGFCDRIELVGLDPGTYFVRVSASPFGLAPTFPYRIEATVQ